MTKTPDPRPIRIGDEVFSIADQTDRLVLADRFQEGGREAEAAILRTPYPIFQQKNGWVGLSLTWLQANLDPFRYWVDSLIETVNKAGREFRGVSWAVFGGGFVRFHLPGSAADRAFVVDCTEAEFIPTFAQAVREWLGKFWPEVDAAECDERVRLLTTPPAE